MKNFNNPSQLTPEQVALFYEMWFGLLSFTNKFQKIVPSMLGRDFHKGVKAEDAGKISKYIWAHPQIFDDYIHSEKLDERKSKIIDSWKKYHLAGEFIVVKYLKNGTVFFSSGKTEKLFLIKGLVSIFEEIWPKQMLPHVIETVLLPFENTITTSGLYASSNVRFGRTMRKEIVEAYQQAELTYGLIATLPHVQTVSKAEKDIARIKFYLQSFNNLDTYIDELEDLIDKNSERYFPIYYQHRGLLEAKKYKNDCRKFGLKKLHFAVLGHVIIAAHVNPREVEKTVKSIVPTDDLNRVIYDSI